VTLLDQLVPTGKATYLVYQEEMCPDTGRIHIQGYAEFPSPIRRKKLQEYIANPCHVEKRMGTPQEAADYCKKEASRLAGTSPKEFGIISRGQGARNDLNEVHAMLQAGATELAIADAHFTPWVKYHKGIRLYKELTLKPRTKATVSIIIWGEGGIGKSHLAFNTFPNSYRVTKGNCGIWYDRYNQEDAVIFDDFKNWISFTDWKGVIDGYKFTVDAKGGQREFTSKFAIFTSNFNPRTDWYDRVGQDDVPFERRLHIILHAHKRTGLDSTSEYVLKVDKCLIPWNANMPDNWALPGLTARESADLIDSSKPIALRKRYASICPIVTKSQSHEVSRSAGVILSPALNGQPFYEAARKLLMGVLFGKEDDSQRIDPPATRSAASSPTEGRADLPDDSAAHPSGSGPAPDPPCNSPQVPPTQRVLTRQGAIILDEEDVELCRLHGLEPATSALAEYKRIHGRDYTPGDEEDLTAQAAHDPRQKPGTTVPHFQGYTNRTTRSNYPNFGVDQPRRKRLGTRIIYDPPGNQECLDDYDQGESLNSDDDLNYSAGEYDSDSFVENDIPVPQKKRPYRK